MYCKNLRLPLALLLLATSAHAITLQWLGGGTDINFTSATRCTLLVGIAAPDTALPRELRLSWVGQNCPDIQVVAEGTADPAELESRVDEVVDRSELESGSRFRNVRIAAAGPHNTLARFVLDLPPGARGNIRAQASGPEGGIQVSNTVTFNAGTAAAFAPVVLESRTVIEDNAVVVHARGVGLRNSRAVRLVTADTAWAAPFELVQLDDNTLIARNVTLNNLPEAMVQATSATGDASSMLGDLPCTQACSS